MTGHTDALNFIVTIIFTFTRKNSSARLRQVCNSIFLIAQEQKPPWKKKGGKTPASGRSLPTIWKPSLQAFTFWNVAPS